MRAMSFGAIADQYDRLRPDPPSSAVRWLLPARRDLLVDVAAGTGKLTRMLAGEASKVVAVEPDIRMSAVLRSQVAPSRSPAIGVVAAVGESLPLRDGSADGLFVSSAWHWLNPDQAIPEIGRVLRDGGRLGLIWTSRDREVDWVREFDRLRDPEPGRGSSYSAAARQRHRDVALPDGHPFADIESATFSYTKTMAVPDLVAAIGTYSGVIVVGDADRAAALARVRAAIDDRFPGASEIDVPIRALCWRATRLSR